MGLSLARGNGGVENDGRGGGHQGQRFLHREQQSFDVGVEDSVEVLRGDFSPSGEVGGAGIGK